MNSISNRTAHLPLSFLLIQIGLVCTVPPQTMAEERPGKLAAKLSNAKTAASDAVAQYRQLESDPETVRTELSDAKQTATRLLQQSLDLDFQVQRAKIQRARLRLNDLEARIDRSSEFLNQLARREFQRRIQATAVHDAEGRFASPKSVLDAFYQASTDSPSRIADEYLTDQAVEELCGVFLQSFSLSSAMMQIGAKASGNEENEIQTMIDAFESHLESHILESPPQAATEAFTELVQTTVGLVLAPGQTQGSIDSDLLRKASGILKSPRDFVRAYSEFMEGLSDETENDSTPAHEPLWNIVIDGDTAVAVDRNAESQSPNDLASSEVLLKRTDGNWIITSLFTKKSLVMLQRAYSTASSASPSAPKATLNSMPSPVAPPTSVYPSAAPSGTVSPNVSPPTSSATPFNQPPIGQPYLATPSVQSPSPSFAQPAEFNSLNEATKWSDFIQTLPESGTVLAMVEDQTENSQRMRGVAEEAAKTADIEFSVHSIDRWRYLFNSPAPHFILLKDRQLVATLSGLLTNSRLTRLVKKAEGYLTPLEAGVETDSLVRIDCYINPGETRIGSQQGSVHRLTGLVVAQHNDRALLIAPDSVASYLAAGFACLIAVEDETGKTTHYPFDTVLEGKISLTDGAPATDSGCSVMLVEGIPPLSVARIAKAGQPLKTGDPVLSGSFRVGKSVAPIRRFDVDTYWQSGTILSLDRIQYHDQNGAMLIQIGYKDTPPAAGFTFNRTGECIGRYALGGSKDKGELTYSVFPESTTRRLLELTAQKLGDDPLVKQLRAQVDSADDSEESK